MKRQNRFVKTSTTFLLLVATFVNVYAQPAPPAPGAGSPIPRRTNRTETSAAAVERATAQATNPAPTLSPRLTNLPSPAAVATNLTAAAAALTNAAAALTNQPIDPAAAMQAAARAGAPPAITPPPATTNLATAILPTPPPVLTRPGIPSPSAATTAAQLTTPRPGIPTIPAPGGANPAVPAPGATITVPPAVAGGMGSPDEIFPPGMIKFQDADLFQVLDVYQDLTGRTVLRPANLPATKITIRTQSQLTRKEAIQALDSILSMNGITMVPQGEKFVKAVPQATAGTEGGIFNSIATEELPEAGQYITQIVHLTNSLPKDIAPALQPFAKSANSILGIDAAGILILRDYAENIKRMMEIIEKIDVVPIQEFEPVVIPIKYALAADIATVLGSLTAGGGGTTTVGSQQTRTGLTSGGGGFGAGGAGGAGGFGNTTGIQGQQGYNQPAGLRGAAGGALGSSAAGRSSFQDRLRSIVNRAASGTGEITVLGSTKIIADERTNALLIFATKADLVSISNIIAKLDVVLAQVIIEALVIEVALTDSLDYGISYLQKERRAGDVSGIGGVNNGIPIANFLGGGTNGSSGTPSIPGLPSGFSYFTKIGNEFDIAMQAAASDGRINVLSRPRVQTSHAVEANLFVGETRPYPTTSFYGGGSFGGYSSIQQLQIGITLSVLPLINPDGLVVMDIRQKVQSVGEVVEIQNVGEVPTTVEREANAKVAVRDGESVLLGGFISNERSKNASGVPFLKDIPLLGNLFRSSSKRDNRRELMVLIRPTVLETPEKAAVVATEEKKRLPGVSSAEKASVEAEEIQWKKIRQEEAVIERKKQEQLAKELYRREGFN